MKTFFDALFRRKSSRSKPLRGPAVNLYGIDDFEYFDPDKHSAPKGLFDGDKSENSQN